MWKYLEDMASLPKGMTDLDSLWYVEKVDQNEEKLSIRLMGSPSDDDPEDFIKLLHIYGAKIIDAKMWLSIAGATDYLRCENGKSVPYKISFKDFVNNCWKRQIKFKDDGTTDINIDNGGNLTLLHCACEAGYFHIVTELIDRKAKLNIVTGGNDNPL